MDEYFCPNCGATLNNQPGFDPKGGTWTCTSCGKLLMDDDVYEGDTFEGVAWYCDNCGELLNRQPGFPDAFGSWRCTNCSHVNGTAEDDIINNGFQCPNCGAWLKNNTPSAIGVTITFARSVVQSFTVIIPAIRLK